jgi:hypothetical protein
MVIIENILKVVATIIVGYIVGLLSGAIFGALFGLFTSFFIQDIYSAQQAVLLSIFVSITLGGLLSLFASQIFNALFETEINPYIGAIPGALVGLVIVFFVTGYVDLPDPNQLHGYRWGSMIAMTPIMFYCTTISSQIASILFPFSAALGTIREMIKSHLELQRNRALMKALPPSHWGLPEIPPKTQNAIPAKPLSPPLPEPQMPIKSAKERILLFSLKTFGLACAVGLILSVLGWQILGWNSGVKFS